jgi:protein TonB
MAFAVIGLAGGFLLGRRGSSASLAAPVTEAVVAPPSAPLTAPPVDAPPVPGILKSVADSSAAAPRSETAAEALNATQPARADNAAQPAPSRRNLSFGKLAAPIDKRPAIASPNEPPPGLLMQASATPENMLGTNVLAGTALAPPSPVRAGGQLQEPTLISSSAPIYPSLARATKVEGVVVLDVLVDATGKVADVKVISGPASLRQAAIDAMRQWKYQPARLNGQPIAIHTNVNINFSLR